MAFDLEIMPSALEEMKEIKVFHRRAIAEAIEEQLRKEPTTPAKNRKMLPDVAPSFEHEPPLWELRVGTFRVFYDVDEDAKTVFVRAVREKPPHATTEEVL